MSTHDNERLDRIEHHLSLLKKNDSDQMTLLLNIENALIGSKQNGHKGIVTDIKEIEERVDDLDDFKKEASVYVRQSKFVIGAIVLALIALLFKAYTPDLKKADKENQEKLEDKRLELPLS